MSIWAPAPESLPWFAHFEARLAWRDTLSMIKAGRMSPQRKLTLGVIALLIGLHGAAFLVLPLVGDWVRADRPTFVVITAALLLTGSAMLAQAMETVTRTFYLRSDLELILSSPVRPSKLFAVRIAGMALSGAFMSALVMGPFINVLAWRGGAQWLGGYGVLLAVSVASTALAVPLTILLFKLVGPKRTRLIAQIAAAVIGGLFVIALQVAAMLSTGTASRFLFLTSPDVLAYTPDITSVLWYPARAAIGDGYCLALVVGGSVVMFAAVTALSVPRFADHALTATSRSQAPSRREPDRRDFRVEQASAALRRKERKLLLRDPWLISQSLMQVLYLIPPAVLLWGSLGRSSAAAIVVVPLLIMTAGQLAGGLAWLTVSGEDAPDLVSSAPVTRSRLLRAKIEVVMQCVAVVLLPLAGLLALVSPRHAVVVMVGSAAAAASSSAIQLWFRSQSKRSHFRRRHTASRIATFSEALVSITWAAAGAVLAVSTWLAAILALLALAMLGAVRAISATRSSYGFKRRRPADAG